MSETETEPKIEQHPGVLILRIPAENGRENVTIQEVGGMDPLAVPTLLRLAATIKEKGFGE